MITLAIKATKLLISERYICKHTGIDILLELKNMDKMKFNLDWLKSYFPNFQQKNKKRKHKQMKLLFHFTFMYLYMAS